MNCTPAYKSDRLLYIHARLVKGDVLNKKELAQRFCVTERSIQRDMESLRCFFTEQGMVQDIIYDKKLKGYRLEYNTCRTLNNSEILAVCKILLESRSMKREEMMLILDKLLDCCVPDSSKKAVTKLIANERFHYIPPRHNRNILPGLWEIGQAVEQHCVMEIEYLKMDGNATNRVVEPVGLMFSEYYFYLVAFVRNEPYTSYFKKKKTLMPAIYRIDRIQKFTVTDEHFTPAYVDRFQEGEFRKRVQFMYGGKLNRVKFKYVGPSIEAVLDRLPTAEIIGQDDEGWFVEAEVFGTGIDMWMRSQGEYVRNV